MEITVEVIVQYHIALQLYTAIFCLAKAVYYQGLRPLATDLEIAARKSKPL